MGRRVALVAAGAVVLARWAAAPAAVAAAPPPLTVPVFGSFNSVLAQGEGQTVNAGDLAAYEASGNPPQSFVSQTPLYAGVMPVAQTLTGATLHNYYKD